MKSIFIGMVQPCSCMLQPREERPTEDPDSFTLSFVVVVVFSAYSSIS